MGSNTSKINQESSHKHDEDLDPRSPTPEIIRTPLHGKTGVKHNITKNVDLRKTFDSPVSSDMMINNNPIFSAVIKNHLQLYDPRSPTQEFDRTPIVIPCKNNHDDSTSDLLNENSFISPCLVDENNQENLADPINIDTGVSKNLCNDFNNFNLDESETSEVIGETYFDISSKPKKLLETNFDYIEFDTEQFEDSINNTFDLDKSDEKVIETFEILDDDPRSPTVGIERTPIVVVSKEEENIEDMSDDKLIKVLQSANVELRQTSKLQNYSDNIIIYEDTDSPVNTTPKKSLLKTDNVRTPLSCVKNKGDSSLMKKTLEQTRNDSNMKTNVSTKMTKKASQIPRLKSLVKHTKVTNHEIKTTLKNNEVSPIEGGCENTPPQTCRDKWDKDSSIVF